MRTRWIDDRILHAIHPSRDLQVRQVVVLGAGMDTRPWRLHLPAGAPSSVHDRQALLEAQGLYVQGIVHKRTARMVCIKHLAVVSDSCTLHELHQRIYPVQCTCQTLLSRIMCQIWV